ncbi:MAG: hypothetical protein AAGD32_17555 [Planctomycetota bacterium]
MDGFSFWIDFDALFSAVFCAGELRRWAAACVCVIASLIATSYRYTRVYYGSPIGLARDVIGFIFVAALWVVTAVVLHVALYGVAP